MDVWLKRIGLAGILVLLAIQLIPVDRHNPPAKASDSVYVREAMPANVRAILQRSCSDCHSNQTHWPWYSYVAPVSWVVSSDVHEARKQMNFSEWGTYSPKKRADRLEEFCEQLMNGNMPDRKYTFIHRRARLTQEERDAVCFWANSSR
jgi:Haem-binding domain